MQPCLFVVCHLSPKMPSPFFDVKELVSGPKGIALVVVFLFLFNSLTTAIVRAVNYCRYHRQCVVEHTATADALECEDGASEPAEGTRTSSSSTSTISSSSKESVAPIVQTLCVLGSGGHTSRDAPFDRFTRQKQELQVCRVDMSVSRNCCANRFRRCRKPQPAPSAHPNAPADSLSSSPIRTGHRVRGSSRRMSG